MDGTLPEMADALHREMQAHARARARLDHDEMMTIRRCLETRLWSIVGCGSMNEYLRRYSNYTAGQARERIKAARELADAPLVREALQSGSIGWNHVVTLKEVVLPETEGAWRISAETMPAAEFRAFASGAARGDRPDDARHEELKPRPVTLEMRPDQYGALDEATGLMRRRDPEITREEVVAHGCRLVIAEETGTLKVGGEGEGEREAGASYLISYGVCPECKRGSRFTRGAVVPVGSETIEKAICDAVLVGSVDGEAAERATSTVTPANRRFVRLRDRGKCLIPGCNARIVEVHHVLFRSEGGAHDPDNLASLCGPHHDLVHDGRVRIEGDAKKGLRFYRSDGRPYSDRSVVPRDVMIGQRVFLELCRAGFRSDQVHRAIEHAWGMISEDSATASDEDRLAFLLEAARRRLENSDDRAA